MSTSSQATTEQALAVFSVNATLGHYPRFILVGTSDLMGTRENSVVDGMYGGVRPDGRGSARSCDFERSPVGEAVIAGPGERLLSGYALRLVRSNAGLVVQGA